MILVIDRFEGDFAVCQDVETETLTDLNCNELPPDTREGDVLIYEDGKLVIDRQQTTERKERIRSLIDDMWK